MSSGLGSAASVLSRSAAGPPVSELPRGGGARR